MIGINKPVILLTMGVFLTPFCMNAETGVTIPTKDIFLLKRKTKKNPWRPQMPGKDTYISVGVANGILTVEFPGEAEWGVVTLNSGMIDLFSIDITRNDNSVELPYEYTGDFLLKLTFDNGEEYDGGITL